MDERLGCSNTLPLQLPAPCVLSSPEPHFEPLDLKWFTITVNESALILRLKVAATTLTSLACFIQK